jgi:SAM-dependent methyltransferase
LLESPPDRLNAADLYLRGSVLEERHGFDAARHAYTLADERLYSGEVRDAMLARLVELVAVGDGTDVATGRGTLLERLLGATQRPLVATDVSETVLTRVRARFGTERVEFVVADARALPFEEGSIATLVSHLGLANVPDAGVLLRELRRVGRELIATHVFFHDDDERNLAAARELGLDGLATWSAALGAFAEAGWSATVELERDVRADPTPVSELVPGVGIDGLPVAPASVTWCVLVARSSRRAASAQFTDTRPEEGAFEERNRAHRHGAGRFVARRPCGSVRRAARRPARRDHPSRRRQRVRTDAGSG